MAPNKKKKKAAANPARGFATTSLPSKTKVVEEQDETQSDTPTVTSGQGVSTASQIPDSKSATSVHEPGKTANISDMSPEELEKHLETSELETMVERYAARSLADASRQVARLDTERRQLRPQAYKLSTYSWLDEETTEELFASSLPALSSGSTSNSVPSPESEEKVLIDLWTIERVLQALKLPRVAEAVAHVAGLAISGQVTADTDNLPGLSEAFRWYAANTQPGELSHYEHVPETKAARSGDNTPLQANSEPVTATQSRQSPASTPTSLSEDEDDSFGGLSVSESDEEDDPSKLSDKYVRIRRLIWQAEHPDPPKRPKLSARKQKRVTRLKERLQKLRRDPLFDEYVAESAWNTILLEIQEQYQHLLRIEASRRREQGQEDRADVHEAPVDSNAPIDDRQHGEADGEALLGGMFEDTDQATANEQSTNAQQQIKVLDFGKWTGVSPRKLLDDICKSHDTKSRLRVQTLQNTSHSARHSVSISWSSDTLPEEHAADALPTEVSAQVAPHVWTLQMVNTSAASSAQSEAYICTLAIFLISTLGGKEQKPTARLPTVWRDVVKDLTDVKQRLVNEEHRETLRRLRTVLHDAQERLQAEQGQTVPRASTQIITTDRRRTKHSVPARLDPSQISREWTSRQLRPSFQQMLEVRRSLPVHQYKDDILSCIANHPVTVICAETGAGKSSGIPVLLLEHDFDGGRDCRILVTQPRRISAITLARRVSAELGETRNDIGTSRSLVGYAIRMESKTSNSTRITYATTGVLLRMLEESRDLDELDYLILDEVHERTMDLDLLFIALQKLQKRRSTLKIVLMSATVDAKKFSDYFGGAPVLDLPGRTFPVEVGFLEDAVEATNDLAGLKDKALSLQDEGAGGDVDDFYGNENGRPVISDPEKYSTKTQKALSSMDEYRIDYGLIAKLAAAIANKPQFAKYSSAILVFMPGIGEMRRLHNLLLSMDTFSRGWVVHLLHSTFSTEDLEKAFDRPPPGHRKVVIATNIAETGITIPDVTAVIDTCKEKVMRFDERRQLSRLTEGFISRSSARQRRGRAARVQDGLCFHLVTRHRHDNLMLEQQVPEMLRLSLQDPMLRIKVWDLGSIEETLNAAIDPPSRKNVLRAIEKLKDAGALTKQESLTPLGQQIARLPLEVSLAKLAIFGVIFRCLDPILAIISLLTSKSPFLSSTGGQPDARYIFSRGDSDLLSSLNAYEAWRKAKSARSGHEFCRKNHISDQAMVQVEENKIQLLVYLVDAGLVTLEAEEKGALSRARSSGGRGGGGTFYTVPTRYNQKVGDRALNAIVAMALYPRILMREGKAWRNVYTNQQVSLTSRSVNHNNPKAPRWLSFYEAMQNRNGNLNVFETSAIPESALAVLLGDAEFKFYAGVMVLDSGKIKLSVKHWRQMMAIKILREQLLKVLDTCFKRTGQDLDDGERKWLDFWLNMEASQE
ncbi:adenosinetriphosphatase [Exophiala viscosa]|uniref:adenosinetriphosphatase n=1 Tax=Exophiala viscosa TaxID=2486360 RepID=UPI00219D60E3|nr:adenosinetriphosphatase [Exophiala viscosa]